MTELERILDALSEIRIHAQPEEFEIHECIARVLKEASIPFTHEHRLLPRCRIDFLCGRVGIEVKKGRPAAAPLRRQLERYLLSPELDCVVVVVQKPCRIPDAIAGKRVYTIALNRLWGVALP